MNYVYDILINLNKKFYDFFEWNQSDCVYHIRKIPIFKISSNDLANIMQNIISVDTKFIECIKNKTDIFNNEKNDLKYCCLFTDSNDAIVVSFDNKGKSILKSDLLIEEALDILEISLHINERVFKYNIEKNEVNTNFFTRNSLKLKNNILKKINEISKEEKEKIKYLYYECFNVEEQDYNKMLNKIKKNIDNEEILNKLNKFFKLISNCK